MTPTKLLIGQILIVLVIMVAGVWAATQWAAHILGYQPELGAPWAFAGDFPLYRPWALYLWWYEYEAYAPRVFDRAGSLAATSGFLGCVLRTGACQQFFREHFLTFASLFRGDYAEARFILVAPRQNHLVQQGAQPAPGAVPFVNIELEQLIEAIGCARELDYAFALHDRYLNWWKFEGIVEEAIRAKTGSWKISPSQVSQPVALVSRAA